jgi:hypothetical protein
MYLQALQRAFRLRGKSSAARALLFGLLSSRVLQRVSRSQDGDISPPEGRGQPLGEIGAPYAFLMISVLSVRASACFMFWFVFSFLLCTAVFFSMFRHHNPPLIFNKPLTIVTISLLLLFMKGSLCILTFTLSSFSFTIKNRVHFSA